jgi:hypothetical protein
VAAVSSGELEQAYAGVKQATATARTSNGNDKNKQRQRPMQGFFTTFRMTAFMSMTASIPTAASMLKGKRL